MKRIIVIGIIFLIVLSILVIPGRVVQAANSASLSTAPSVLQVSPGTSFDVTVRLNANFQTRGMQIALSWDPARVQCNSLVQGGFYKDFAQAHNATVVLDPSSLNYDNTTGKFPKIGAVQTISLDGGDTETVGGVTNRKGPSGEGDVFILHMTAKTGVSGPVAFTLSNAIIVDNSIDSHETNPAITNGQVTISDTSSTDYPTITSFNPTSGGNGTPVVITGANFPTGLSGGSAVQFGNTNAQSYTVNSATQITAVVPNLGTASVSVVIKVTTSGGTATSSGNFSYTTSSPSTLIPAIRSFDPVSGGSGTLVVITGTNFTGATAVQFGGVSANSYNINSSGIQITASVGNGSSGVITIVTPSGTATSSASFTFNGTPTATPIFTTPPATSPVRSPTLTPIATPSSTTPPAVMPAQSPTPTSNSTQLGRTENTLPITRTPQKTSKKITKSQTSVNTMDISDLIDTGGVLQDNFQQTNIGSGNNRIINLDIKSGTRALDKNGNPLESITIQPANAPLAPPQGKTIISTIEFGPSGATFSLPISIIYEYDPVQLPQGIDPGNLALVYFDTQGSKWVACDYTLDTQTHRMTANISHFSLYAILGKGNESIVGSGWGTAGAIILVEVLIGTAIIYLFMRRRRPLLPASAAIANTASSNPTKTTPIDSHDLPFACQSAKMEVNNDREGTRVLWDELLPQKIQRGEPFKTHLEITGGTVVIPRDGKSTDIELINSPDSRIMISLEYDPELHPKGMAKILILGTASENEKSKEIRK